MSKIIEGLLYSESHEWVKVDGNVAIIGVSDFAQSEMGDITYVDMPDVDDEFNAGDDFGALESVKTPASSSPRYPERWLPATMSSRTSRNSSTRMPTAPGSSRSR